MTDKDQDDKYLRKFHELVQRSQEFDKRVEFKTDLNRIERIAENDEEKKRKIGEHAESVRVIIHTDVKRLIEAFLNHKRADGTEKEKEIYKSSTEFGVDDFVERALRKRPLAFFGSNDITFLREDFEMPLPSDWNRVGTDAEGAIKIADYMTYDEIAISALLGVSVPTYFINTGGRNNVGQPEDEKEEYGIYVALTGARFEKKDKMESLHMLVTENATSEANGYGRKAIKTNPHYKLLNIWAHFYQMELEPNVYGFPSWDEVHEAKQIEQKLKDPPEPDYKPPIWLDQFVEYKANSYAPVVYINHRIYKRRIELIIEPFLEEANLRAQAEKKKAYIHAIGLGLGVWQICPQQADWMFEVYKNVLTNGKFDSIQVIDFSWFPELKDKPEVIKTASDNIIKIKFSRRDPAEKLLEDNCLLVAMYAWDGNSFPGNEYWRGMLHASGDPAAACCSTITELQNPEINTDFVKHIKWLGEPKSKL